MSVVPILPPFFSYILKCCTCIVMKGIVEVQYSLKLDISKVAQDLAEGSKSFSELLYDKALRVRQ